MSDYQAVALCNSPDVYIRLHDTTTGAQYDLGAGMVVEVYLTEDAGEALLDLLDYFIEDGLLPEDRDELPGGYVNMDDENYDA